KGNVARGIPCGYDTKGAARYAISEENVGLLGIALIGGPHQAVNICSGPVKCDSPRSRSCIMRWQCFGDLLSRDPEAFKSGANSFARSRGRATSTIEWDRLRT